MTGHPPFKAAWGQPARREPDIALAENHNYWMQLGGLELFDVHGLPGLHICNMMGFHCLSPIVWLLEEKD